MKFFILLSSLLLAGCTTVVFQSAENDSCSQNVESNENSRLQTVSTASDVAKQLLSDLRKIPGTECLLGKYEVSQRQFEAVLGINPSHFKGDRLPVESVSWTECREFIDRLNKTPEVLSSEFRFRFPTEQELIVASRTMRMSTDGYWIISENGVPRHGRTWNEDPYVDANLVWFKDNSGGKTHPIGTKDPNEWGFYDMWGNVWEWTDTPVGDAYEYLGGGFDNFFLVGRGITVVRNWGVPSYRSSSLGLRVAASSQK